MIAAETLLVESPGILQVLEEIHLAVSHGVSVLLCGEAGSGKTFLARVAQHLYGWPFTMVSCERIDQGLGAGQFQGTALWPDHMIHVDTLPVDAVVVLDDVDRLGIPAQTQLLYWMEQMEQVFEALDPARRLPCFISTARRELFRDAAAQTFRPRLYYRLSGMEIVVPPLRERREDITRLAHAFIKEIARQLGTAVPALDDSAMDLLRQPPWPGNVTQFEAVLQRAMAEFAVGRPFADALRNAVLIYSLTEPRPNLRRAPIFV